MNPIYLDLHIHTSENPNQLNENYDLDCLVQKIKEYNKDSDFLISLTDHNTINKSVYLKAKELEINIILGVELHIRNYDDCPAYHCHIYFDLEEITEQVIDDLNSKFNELYPNKIVEKTDKTIPLLQEIINKLDAYEFLLLPHGGQSHATFDTSIKEGVKFDTTLEKSIYYNQFDGFTARGEKGLDKTQEYFKKLGINEFVNLVTCSDNYNPNDYPKAKAKDAQPFTPTWMLANPTFNGLRLSLSEHSRLIYSNDKPKIWSENIKSVKHRRDNIEIDVQLTSGLNVIIGGSSSGKTLLADSIVKYINKDTANTAYAKFEIDKMQIDNPSGMSPHYLSQNYIMKVVTEASDDKLEDIEIIKQVFPGDTEIKEKIDNGLLSFKKNIQNLIKNVKTIEEETNNLSKIPVLSRLITKEKVANNIFENLLPTQTEIKKLEFSETKHSTFIGNLEDIETFLANYPFITHNSNLTKELKDELNAAFESFKQEKDVRAIVKQEKEGYDRFLRANDTEDQTKKQNFERLLISLKNYFIAYKSFYKSLKNISEYTLNFGSEEIESMGHKLFIENNFVLNKEKFIEVVNRYLKDGIDRFDNIMPKHFFDSSNFKKKSPKVQDYEDFEHKIYNAFEELNKKKYKIITNDGRKFEDLSPGWKTSVILDLILGYDKDISPIIIDQPEDNLATNYINKGLVSAIKKIKAKKQIILVSHNATIPMLADAQNIVLCRNENNKLIIKSSPLEGKIDGKYVVDYIAEITDGGKSSIKKRVKKYNLKKFTE
jgi:hypothetical protein